MSDSWKKTLAALGVFAIFCVAVLLVGWVVHTRSPMYNGPPIATRQELINQGIIPKPVSRPVPAANAEADPQLSPEAKEALRNKEELKRAKDKIETLEHNPYETVMKYNREQELKVVKLQAQVNWLTDEAIRLKAELRHHYDGHAN